ncbi:hypothetical protein A3844_03450 [Paenibacillus helianthi]|uniref:Uncharacterized protein n=1 Tax=Paenibacillus helianthi TaxID=1349432 RepID=A0ABX3ESK0_9BACL|nr:hypothetical protein A3844_03450 [Paenibacillus helianthi]
MGFKFHAASFLETEQSALYGLKYIIAQWAKLHNEQRKKNLKIDRGHHGETALIHKTFRNDELTFSNSRYIVYKDGAWRLGLGTQREFNWTH